MVRISGLESEPEVVVNFYTRDYTDIKVGGLGLFDVQNIMVSDPEPEGMVLVD